VQRLYDLPFGNSLTPADNPAVQRIFLNESSLFLGGKVPEHCALAGIGKVLFFYGFQAAATQQLHRLFRYGRRGGKSRGTDPGQIDKARRLFGFLYNKILLLGIAAYPGKIADALPVIEIRHAAGSRGAHLLQPKGSIGHAFHILHSIGAGPNDQIPVNGGGD